VFAQVIFSVVAKAPAVVFFGRASVEGHTVFRDYREDAEAARKLDAIGTGELAPIAKARTRHMAVNAAVTCNLHCWGDRNLVHS
jgi:hypothetical protein